jgi:ubiquinone/menaquinone biosynthesis C-methylase UbiE
MNPETLPGNSGLNIVCPTCKAGELVHSAEKFSCTACGASFPVKNGILDLLPGSREPPAAAPMVLECMGRFYESVWWRRNPVLTALIMGIPFDKEYELIVKAAHITGDETLLDLACGPGTYTRPFAQILNRGTVVGLDLSFGMLNYAKKQAQTEGISNLLFIRGDALNLPFPDNQFDAVNCCGALHLFPYPQVLEKVCRILKPGGRFTVGAVRHIDGGSLTRLREYLWHKCGVHPFPQDELASLLEGAGLADVTWHHAKRCYQVVSAVKLK